MKKKEIKVILYLADIVNVDNYVAYGEDKKGTFHIYVKPKNEEDVVGKQQRETSEYKNPQ